MRIYPPPLTQTIAILGKLLWYEISFYKEKPLWYTKRNSFNEPQKSLAKQPVSRPSLFF